MLLIIILFSRHTYSNKLKYKSYIQKFYKLEIGCECYLNRLVSLILIVSLNVRKKKIKIWVETEKCDIMPFSSHRRFAQNNLTKNWLIATSVYTTQLSCLRTDEMKDELPPS